MGYLAFDLGASSGKLYYGSMDGNRLLIEPVYRFENYAIPLNGGLYWDFLNIWRNLCTAIQKANASFAFRSIGVDTYSNDFSFINRAGELLSPVRCYRDIRTKRCERQIYETVSKDFLYHETGNQIAPFSTLMQLAAMRIEHSDAVMDSAYKMLFLPDLIGYYISNEIVSERTVSSVSQLYRFQTGDWSDKILNAFRLPRELFGALTDPATVTGSATNAFRKEWGVQPFNFISVCEHDTASAFIASPGDQNRVIISAGTWSLVGCENESPVICEIGFRHNIANEGGLPGYHRILRNVMGSWILQELNAEYKRDGESYTFAELESFAEKSAPFAFLIDVDDPAFFSPGNMREKIREKCLSIDGRAPESPGEFARCICESLALKYRWVIEKLQAATDRVFTQISVIGGGSNDMLTCQFTANACRLPVVAGPADASAIGNILTQMIARREIADVSQGRELVKSSFPFRQFEPQDLDAWEEAYGRLSPIFSND